MNLGPSKRSLLLASSALACPSFVSGTAFQTLLVLVVRVVNLRLPPNGHLLSCSSSSPFASSPQKTLAFPSTGCSAATFCGEFGCAAASIILVTPNRRFCTTDNFRAPLLLHHLSLFNLTTLTLITAALFFESACRRCNFWRSSCNSFSVFLIDDIFPRLSLSSRPYRHRFPALEHHHHLSRA